MLSKFQQTLGIGILGLAFMVAGFSITVFTFKLFSYVLFLICGIALTLIPMTVAIQILIVYLGFEGFAKLMTGYNPIIHIGADILIFLLLARTALSVLINRENVPTTFPPLTALFGVHFLWFLITILNPNSLSLLASLAGCKLYVTIVSLYFFGYYLSSDIHRVRRFFMPWVVVCAFQVATSMYQSSIGPSSVLHLSPYYGYALKKLEGYAFRPFGLTSQPGAPAIFVYISVSFILYFIFQTESLVIGVALLCLLSGSVATLLVCQVRSALFKGIVCFAGYLLIMAYWLRSFPERTRTIFVPFAASSVAVIFIVTPIIVTKLSSSFKDNQRAIERTLSLFDHKKIANARSGAMDRFLLYAKLAPLGVGLSRNGAAAGKFQDIIKQDRVFAVDFFTDNLWVAMTLDLGLPGAFIVTLLLVSIMYLGTVGLSTIQDPQIRAAYGAIYCTLFAILLGAYGAEPILYNPEGGFFWFFSGVLMRLPTLEHSKNIILSSNVTSLKAAREASS